MKILIVNKSFALGGIESAMINMTNELVNYYDVDLFIFNPVGVMKERLDSRVTILEPSWRFKALGMSLLESVKSRSLKIIVFRLFATVWSKLFSNKLPINIAIKHQKKLTGYDMAVAYHHELGKKSTLSGFSRMVYNSTDAKRKVAWLHFDSDTLDLDSQYNNQFYKKMDKIVCVSKSLMNNFSRAHTDLSNIMDYCYNFMLYGEIKEKAEAPQEIAFPADKFICFSACRLAPEKALPRSISALSDMFKKHPEVVWYIAGDGVERENIEKAIKENGLEQQIILIGHQSNPYPYICNANLVLNVSYHEAAPMVFLESKSLGTPVFATKTSSAEELLNNNVDSFICENSEKGIHDTFSYLMENKSLISNAREVLKDYKASNEESLLKIKDFIE